MSGPLRWGILSTGSIAHTFARDLQFVDDGVVAAVGSRSQPSADEFGDEFDVPRRYGSYLELVQDEEVDVVYVATPQPMHLADASLALENGKPVLVEKSFTKNGTEARELVALARSRDLFVMEAMWTRFLPHVVALRALISQGALGEIVTVEADLGRWFDKDPNLRHFAPEFGGGALLDMGVYPVSFASMILGTPERVVAMVDPAFTGVNGQTSMLFGYAGGAHAVLTCTTAANTPTRASISGSEARVEIEANFFAPTSFTVISREGERERFEFATRGHGLHYEAEEVARCLREGLKESPSMPLDESVSIMETMDHVLSLLRTT